MAKNLTSSTVSYILSSFFFFGFLGPLEELLVFCFFFFNFLESIVFLYSAFPFFYSFPA